jgi:GrpB-like predicted nucleotidyltransferase (UPF0157 family)
VLLLEHVGSTAVPGLWAKPVIELVLAVADSADEPSYVPALEKQEFVLRLREPSWFEHRLFRYPHIDSNLHVFTFGCEEITHPRSHTRLPLLLNANANALTGHLPMA